MWVWILGGLVAWALAAMAFGLLVGRGIRLADDRASGNDVLLDLVDAAPVPVRHSRRRRRVPLPPIGVGLAGTAVALETAGYVSRLSGASGATARILSMDAPYSLPRMFVAAIFAAAAVAAVAGAARIPARRTWWLAVGFVAAGIAGVKAVGTLHASVVAGLGSSIGSAGAIGVSLLLAGTVLAALAVLSRAERRDRRRVLGCLAAYAAASVGLSALSAVSGGSWGVALTYLEESGEALAGVALLVAVLVGVAPRLVLPASWALRRQADAHTIEVAGRLPGAVHDWGPRPPAGRAASEQ